MANIKINNTRKLDFKIRKDEYWDLMLSKEDSSGAAFDWDDNACLAAFVSPEEGECIRYFDKGKVFSSVSWGSAVNSGDDEMSGVTLYNIGFTGVDNGLVFYDKNLIDNAQFFKYYTESFYSTCGDTRLSLSVSRCNTGEHIYPIRVVDDQVKYFECKGGFLQGFYKTYGYDYQTLPNIIEDEWNMSFVIRPRSDYQVLEGTLNYEHPKNKGIFFYMGMRAENKFWDVDATDGEKSGFTADRYNIDGGYDTIDSRKYVQDDCSEEFQFIEETGAYEDKCPVPEAWADDSYISEGYEQEEGTVLSGCPTAEDSMDGDYIHFNPCEGEDDPWIEAGYTVKEISLDGITDIETSNGHNIFENTDNYYEIKSDNKYLLFNNTCSGYTVEKWEKEGAEDKTFIFTTKKNSKIPNYYLLFNNTCTGYTVDTIGEYLNSIKEPYDLYSDYIRNAFALKYNDDGSLTYKYIVKDLGSGCPTSDYSDFQGDYINDTTHIIEETTLPGLVKDGEWTNVHLRFKLLGNGLGKCDTNVGGRLMKIYIYVGGLLKFISRPIPAFNFRELAEVYDKQESVPYNISLGGGTQGLADTVGLNFMDYTPYELPLEKYFGGTFLGDIRLFKFWSCPMNFAVINALKKRVVG